jgi:alanine racemase
VTSAGASATLAAREEREGRPVGGANVTAKAHSDVGALSAADAIERDRCVMEVDLDAVTHNAGVIAGAVGEHTGVMAILKGDAYGMGADMLALHLQDLGVKRLGSDNAAEAVRLREAGFTGPVTVLYGESPDRAGVYVEHDLMPTIYDVRQVSACTAACKAHDAELAVWLGVNLGFNRAGPREDAGFLDVLRALRGAPRLRVAGVLAHLTSAHRRSARNDTEIAAFAQRSELARDCLGAELKTSLLASHGVLRWAKTHRTDCVRPGLLLAGEHCLEPEVACSEPAVAEMLAQLRPAIGIRARVIHIVDVGPSEGVGYTPRVSTGGWRRLATVALGFRSGFPTKGDAPPAICRGRLAERIGPMGMDSLQLDVTDVADVDVGDWVTLVGETGGSRVSLAAVCSAAAVTPYQFLARLRLQHRYRAHASRHSEASS